MGQKSQGFCSICKESPRTSELLQIMQQVHFWGRELGSFSGRWEWAEWRKLMCWDSEHTLSRVWLTGVIFFRELLGQGLKLALLVSGGPAAPLRLPTPPSCCFLQPLLPLFLAICLTATLARHHDQRQAEGWVRFWCRQLHPLPQFHMTCVTCICCMIESSDLWAERWLHHSHAEPLRTRWGKFFA